MLYSRGVVLAHEVGVGVRLLFAGGHRAAQLCGRLPQDLGRVPPVLGNSVHLDFVFVCGFAMRISAYIRSWFGKGIGGQGRPSWSEVNFEERAPPSVYSI